jgi:hypothetical protein
MSTTMSSLPFPAISERKCCMANLCWHRKVHAEFYPSNSVPSSLISMSHVSILSEFQIS